MSNDVTLNVQQLEEVIRKGQYCFCVDREDKTVVFLAIGPHARAYTMR